MFKVGVITRRQLCLLVVFSSVGYGLDTLSNASQTDFSSVFLMLGLLVVHILVTTNLPFFAFDAQKEKWAGVVYSDSGIIILGLFCGATLYTKLSLAYYAGLCVTILLMCAYYTASVQSRQEVRDNYQLFVDTHPPIEMVLEVMKLIADQKHELAKQLMLKQMREGFNVRSTR